MLQNMTMNTLLLTAAVFLLLNIISVYALNYTSNSTNSTLAGTPVMHSLYWQDSTDLSGYIFSFDSCTNSLINDSWNDMTGAGNWSNVTKTINSTIGCNVKWCVYVNDSSNNWNGTSCQNPFTYTTTAADNTPPTCVLISRTPSKINDSSTGTFNVLINCTDPSGINVTKIGDHYWTFATRTLEENIIPGLPNYWSVRYPSNNLAVVDPHAILPNQAILRAQGRNTGKWYENLTQFNHTILNDTYSYAIDDGGDYGDLIITIEGTTNAIINVTGLIEVAAFRQMFYLDKHDMGVQQKYNWTIKNNNPVLTKSFDFEASLNSSNYTMNIFRNLDYDAANVPTDSLITYYCNSSYSPIVPDASEYYNTGDDGSIGNAYAGYKTAQTFIPQVNHTITSVTLKLFSNGNPGQISVGIFATNHTTAGIYFPIGNALATNGTQPDPSSTNSSVGAWETYSFGAGYSLTAGVVYAIVVSASGGNGANSVGWRSDTTSPTYTNGMAGQSTSSGVWSNSSMHPGTDNMFYENGTTGTTVIASPFCVQLDSLLPANITTYYTYLNSSYTKRTYSVNNRIVGGIKTTSEYYFAYQTTSAKDYYIRYANGSTVTNVPFNETKVAWTSTNGGTTWIQANWTPDVFTTTTKKTGDEYQFGIYVADLAGNAYYNWSLFSDDITTTNHPISAPQISEYNSSATLSDTDLNGTHSGIMNILILPAIDPDSMGNVTHNLTLRNIDGTYNYTINGSFKFPDDSALWINFNTSLVPKGIYRMNILATSGDNPLDIQSSLTNNNFTIDNTPPPSIYSIDSIPNQDPREGSIKTVTFNISINNPGGYSDITVVNTTLSKTGEIERNGNCSAGDIINSTARNFSCSVDMMFYDAPGTWDIKACVENSRGFSNTSWSSFTYNPLTAWNMTPHLIAFPTLYIGNTNVLAYDYTIMQNIGNVNLSNIEINATNLIGLNYSNVWSAGNFSVNATNTCEGTQLSSNTYVSVLDATLPRGSSSYENLYFCADNVPSIRNDIYDTSTNGQWTIRSVS